MKLENLDIKWNLVALAFSISGSFCTAMGFICIKLANIAIEQPENKGKSVWLHKYMLIGMFFLACSQILNAFALGLGNIILISSTSCFTIVFNAILSPIILKEKFEFKLDGVTIILVATGSITAVSQQPEVMPNYSKMSGMDILVTKFKNKLAIAFVACIFLLILIRNIMIFKIDKKLTAFYQNTLENYKITNND